MNEYDRVWTETSTIGYEPTIVKQFSKLMEEEQVNVPRVTEKEDTKRVH